MIIRILIGFPIFKDRTDLMKNRLLKLLRKFKSISAIFFISYIIVLIVPMIIGSIIYFKSEKVLAEQISNSNDAVLTQMKHTVDSRLDEINRLSNQISVNKNVNKLMYMNGPINLEERLKISDIVSDFSSFKNITPFIDEFYLYLSNLDYIVTYSSSSESSFYYKVFNANKDMSYDEWMEKYMRTFHQGQFSFSKSMLIKNTPTDTLTYMQSLPGAKNGMPIGNIGIVIQTDKFKELMSSVKGIHNGAAYILDANNNIITSYGAEQIKGFRLPDYYELKGEYGVINEYSGEKDYVISFINSNNFEWKYIVVFPKNIIQEKINYVRSFTLLAIAICMVITILLIIYMTYRNYKPIKRITSFLNSNSENKSDNYGNELKFIEEAVASAVDKNKQYSEKFIQYIPILKVNLLSKLIKGQLVDYDSVKKIQSVSNVNLPYEKFVVVFYYIENPGNFMKEDSGYEWSLTRFIITNISEELANEKGIGYTLELENDTMAMILNIKDKDLEEIKCDINSIVEKTKKTIEEHYKITMPIGIGRICSALEDIQKSYQEAVKAADYQIVRGINSIIYYDEIGHDTTNYEYTSEMETALINYVKAGAADEAERLLNEIFDENFYQRKLPLELIRCLIFDVISTAIKTLNSIQIDYEDVFGEKSHQIDRLLACKTVNDAYEQLRYTYRKLCEYIHDHKKSHNNNLMDNIIKYINENYMNENLSQTFLADYFQISPTYLSNFFKDQTGVKMTSYIAKVRMEKAKELLKDNSLTIADISQRVGCSNVMTLIRTFKKVEGITPGQYRENIGI